MRTALLLASLLFAAPVAASINIYPTLAGSRYCQLRYAGVAHGEALRIALEENIDPTPGAMAYINGKYQHVSHVLMAKYIVRNCSPQPWELQ